MLSSFIPFSFFMRNISRSQVDIFISISVTSAIILFDRLSKAFFSDLLSFGESLPIIKDVFHMTLVHNTGIAFGFFKGNGFVPIVMTFMTLPIEPSIAV